MELCGHALVSSNEGRDGQMEYRCTRCETRFTYVPWRPGWRWVNDHGHVYWERLGLWLRLPGQAHGEGVE